MLFKIIYNQKEVLNGRPAKHHDIGDKIQFEHKKGKSLFDRFMTKEVAEVSMKKFIYDNLNQNDEDEQCGQENACPMDITPEKQEVDNASQEYVPENL